LCLFPFPSPLFRGREYILQQLWIITCRDGAFYRNKTREENNPKPVGVEQVLKKSKRRVAVTRRLVPLKRAIEEAEERGEDTDALFIDPDDIVELEEDNEE